MPHPLSRIQRQTAAYQSNRVGEGLCTLLALLTIASCLGGCKRAPTPSPVDATANVSAFSGSASCRACHPHAYDVWAGSHHAQAERLVQEKLDRPAFDPPRELKHGTQKTLLQWTKGQPEIASIGLSHQMEMGAVARVIGEDPLRQFLITFPGGRWQVQEASYDPRANEWFNVFGNEDRQPGEWGHWSGRGMNWNAMCAACHNTRVQKNYDAVTDTYHTAMQEPTVSCEACHGPLKAHVDWERRYGGSGRKDPAFPKFSGKQLFDMCSSCHARRADLTGDFKPGDEFYDHFELSTVDASELFYPDGQIHDEDYELSAFLGSKMHQAGLTCLDCHPRSLHMARLNGNELCLQCHSGANPKAPVINPTQHSHHATASKGNECAGCHMPQTVYMQRHSRHDHGFTIPDPLLTKQFAVPNACNRCHADRSTDWALKQVDTWYGGKMQRPTRERVMVIARARKGDDSVRTDLVGLLQSEMIPYWRAVAAGLLGNWPAEKEVTLALVRGLDDPDALVRSACVRSLAPIAGDEAISKALQPKLSDALRNVRIAAAWALRATLDLESPAGRDLQRMLDYNADQPTGQLQLGAFHTARNNPELALAHLQKAVAWDAQSPVLRQELAVGLSATGRTKEAVAQLEEAVRLAPKDAQSHYQLALACNEAGDAKRAATELATTVQLEPRHARAWYNLGLAQNAQGETDQALNSLARAESAEPRDPGIPYARATILARLGRRAEARAAVARALELQPASNEARSLLRLLYEQQP